ncbi:MAG: stalk domain-containing protein [Fimbriimonadaceae bacterium]
MKVSRLVGLAVFFLVASSSFAQVIRVTVNGDPVTFIGTGPQMIGGRVLVPLRGVMEKLGAQVGYDGATKRISAQKGNIDLTLTIGSTAAIVNGEAKTLDVPAQMISGTTMVPLRFMGESLGADIKWDATTSTIAITTGTGVDTNTSTVTISGFQIDAPAWVKKGSAADFRLTGTAGGQATAVVSGANGEVRLTEGPAGTYTGRFIPTDTSFLKESSVVARLVVGKSEKLIQAGRTISVDGSVPRVRNFAPDSSVNLGTPDISLSYSDEGSGLDFSKITIRVDGVDVTKKASINPDFIFYRPSEALPKRNGIQVVVHVQDLAGNSTEATWSFNVANATAGKVTIFDHTARQGVEPKGKISFRLDTEPGSRVTLTSSNGVIKDLPMKESPAGVFRGVYQLKDGDTFNNDKVIATVVLPSGTSFTTEAVKRIARVGSKTFGPAAITSHKAGDKVAGNIILQGNALPGVKVNVRLSYATTMLGQLRVTGNLADVTVTADALGNWKTDPIDTGLTLKGSNTEYTVTATAIDPAGKAAEATVVKLKG